MCVCQGSFLSLSLFFVVTCHKTHATHSTLMSVGVYPPMKSNHHEFCSNSIDNKTIATISRKRSGFLLLASLGWQVHIYISQMFTNALRVDSGGHWILLSLKVSKDKAQTVSLCCIEIVQFCIGQVWHWFLLHVFCLWKERSGERLAVFEPH